MKQGKGLLLAAICCVIMTLCGCSYESKIIGTWTLCGEPDIKGSDFDFKRASQ